ncbi:rRNA pseudouridine synthase [Candidatus Gracilibacteria bacterium]|nr:rRNA pseudouridine synthase [Candidatus Gracilibacteria bacterium]MCF7856444.1 rRNA pseudouridine synthase [Candidatus Gracilibacteria bacterium]MCF7896561.1 rRNA pseudouridine synthase [Candidatus Gracilibacteria bacterium]
MKIRLNKFLAEKGIASRRKSDDLIATGKIKVNGEVIKELGIKIDSEKDEIEVDEKFLAEKPELVYFVLNKPLGFVCSNSPTANEKQIVIDLLPTNPRIFPIGRLDKMTTGLLILTNDGNLSFRLTHPSFECEKEYEVELAEDLTAERIRKIEAGVKLERQATQPTSVKVLNARKARIILREGKNRQVRKIFGKVGCEVVSLKRVRVKNLELENLAVGKFRELTKKEAEDLRK